MTTLRLKLAKWLAPSVFQYNDRLEEIITTMSTTAANRTKEITRLTDVLRRVSAQRTPGSNATVRRICDIADAEMGR